MELVHEIYCVWSRMFGIFKSKEVSSCQKWFILSSREIAEQKVLGNTSHAKSFISFLFVSNKTIRLLDVISFRVAPIRPLVIVWTQLLFCVDFRSTKSMYTHSSSTIQNIPWYYSCFECEQFVKLKNLFVLMCGVGSWGMLWLWRKLRETRVNKTATTETKKARW